MESVTTFITKKLGLKVNVEKSKVARPKQIKYLGFGFYKNNKGTWRPKPHIKSVKKFVNKLKEITDRSGGKSIDYKIERLNQVTRGWINYFKIADMKNTMKEDLLIICRAMREKIMIEVIIFRGLFILLTKTIIDTKVGSILLIPGVRF